MKRDVYSMSVLIVVFSTIVSAEPVQWPASEGGNDHYYEAILVPEGIAWTDANLITKSKGGNWHLVTISSEEENAFAYSLVQDAAFWKTGSLNSLGPWLGGYKQSGWKWVTGEAFSYTRWGPSEPFGNGDKIAFYGYRRAKGQSWNDAYDSHKPYGYIIESETAFAPPVRCLGDNLWNIRWFGCDYGHENDFILNRDGTPVCGSGNCPGTPNSCWGIKITQQSGSFPGMVWNTEPDGAIAVSHGQDFQVYGDTFLYVQSPTTLSVPVTGDIVHIWLNDAMITTPSPITLELAAGWNHLEWTAYNQNQAASFTMSYPFAANVDWMSSSALSKSNINCDEIVNFIDYAILVEHWQEASSPVDLAPLPDGDGMMNILDLAAFVEHWLEETSP